MSLFFIWPILRLSNTVLTTKLDNVQHKQIHSLYAFLMKQHVMEAEQPLLGLLMMMDK